ncbi:MAG: multidrug effflux MFS transporter [Rhizobiaceae bacterium]|nr:multidrug effflux MFS transporter [Rhizobiaceae bacterium]
MRAIVFSHNAEIMFSPQKPLAMAEFVSLLAFMISILALSIDAMLPALGIIADDLRLENPNDVQLVISAMFFGFAIGQILAGPLSDCYGRKRIIYIGYAIFIVGCLLSMATESFAIMLLGRVLQGLGAAAPRIIGIAIVRDGYEGRAMASIMSIVMAIFILVPAIAPAIGQGILLIADWRAIFAMLLIIALLALLWFAARQPETLSVKDRRVFSLSALWQGIKEALYYRRLTGYMTCAGLVFAGLLGYLNTAQQIFQDIYGTGDLFAVYFGAIALAIGVSSVLNSKLVLRLGMRFISFRGVITIATLSLLFLPIVLAFDGVPPLWMFMTWLFLVFFCFGMLFGNLNALAMEPVGHMAGLGAAVHGSLSTVIGIPFGWAIGAIFNGTILPLVVGFALLNLAAIAVMFWTERGVPR